MNRPSFASSSTFATLIAWALASAPVARAEDVDTSNHADTVLVGLSPYSIGLGAGAFSSVNSELGAASEAFLKLSLVQSLQFGEHLLMGVDVDWFAPGGNWGGDMTVSYLFGHKAVKPFIGAGAGFHYFDKPNEDFGLGLGPSVVAHVGLVLDVMDELQMRIRLPFHFVGNDTQDRLVGLDMAFTLGSPLRNKRVKKLVY
jgi:hypothetical protein